jgi:hypothetical protein
MTDIINIKIELRTRAYSATDAQGEMLSWLIAKLDLENAIKDFLIDGYLAYRIVWDVKNENNSCIRMLSSEESCYNDNQTIIIDYATDVYAGVSYVEKLIKPYNQLKTIEENVVMQSVINASKTEVFTVPIKGMAQHKAEEQNGKMIKNYSEIVEWDDTLGHLIVNGEKRNAIYKQIWLPDGECGKTTQALHHINTPVTDVTILNYFKNNLFEASRINDNSYCEKIAKKLSELYLKPMRLLEEKQK